MPWIYAKQSCNITLHVLKGITYKRRKRNERRRKKNNKQIPWLNATAVYSHFKSLLVRFFSFILRFVPLHFYWPHSLVNWNVLHFTFSVSVSFALFAVFFFRCFPLSTHNLNCLIGASESFDSAFVFHSYLFYGRWKRFFVLRAMPSCWLYG